MLEKVARTFAEVCSPPFGERASQALEAVVLCYHSLLSKRAAIRALADDLSETNAGRLQGGAPVPHEKRDQHAHHASPLVRIEPLFRSSDLRPQQFVPWVGIGRGR